MEHSENCTCQGGWACPNCWDKIEDENTKLKAKIAELEGIAIDLRDKLKEAIEIDCWCCGGVQYGNDSTFRIEVEELTKDL